jgi:hypothetical protein
MEKMHNEDPMKCAKEMKPKWEAAAETSEHGRGPQTTVLLPRILSGVNYLRRR